MGKPLTEEHKKNISRSLIGKKRPPRSEEHRKNLGKARWRGGRYEQHGYVNIWRGPKERYVREHRHIMEEHLGRKLLRSEEIHHKNAIKNDNRIENLEIMVTGFIRLKCAVLTVRRSF